MFERGFWRVGTVAGVPLRVHWSTPLGALLFGGFGFAPAAWVGFFVIVIIHELGHAFVVRRLRHRVVAIDVTGFGGLCHWSGAATPLGRSMIAWGGVLAQGVLLTVAVVAGALGAFDGVPFGSELAHTLVWTNLWLVVLNLLPFPPLDGAEAWRFFGEFARRRRAGLDARAGRKLFESILSQPVPRRRSAPPRGGSGPVAGPASGDKPGGGPAPTEPASPPSNGGDQRDLADLLRKIGDEAGRARRRGG